MRIYQQAIDRQALDGQAWVRLDEFCQAVISKDGIKVPLWLKKVLMLEVIAKLLESGEIDNSHVVLGGEFGGLLESSAQILAFLNELENSCFDVDSLPRVDVYGEYESDLLAIQKIANAYQQKCSELSFSAFSFGNLEFSKLDILSLDVHCSYPLTNYQRCALQSLSVPVKLCVRSDRFSLFEYPLGRHEIDFANGKILKSSPIESSNCEVFAIEVSSILDRTSFIIDKLADNPGDFAIVSEDESLILALRACGVSDLHCKLAFRGTQAYEKVRQIVHRFNFDMALEQILNDERFVAIFDLASEFLRFLKYFDGRWELLREVFLAELDNLRVDSLGGGVRVATLQDALSLRLDNVIVDNFSLKSKTNDLFLNAKMRSKMGLLTPSDKISLRAQNYCDVILGAKRAFFLCKDLETLSFLKTFSAPKMLDSKKALFPKIDFDYKPKDWGEFFCIPKDFTLSSSKISRFLDCTFGFYLEFIEGLSVELDSEFLQTGSEIHGALNRAFNAHRDNPTLARRAFERDIAIDSDKYSLRGRIFSRLMDDFWRVQEEHFRRGARVQSLELSFEKEIFGRKFRGKIDRVDLTPNGLVIFDYKTTLDFNDDNSRVQLELYQKVLELDGALVSGAYFIDLSGKIAIGSSKISLEDALSKMEGKIAMKRCEKCAYCKHFARKKDNS